MSQHQTENFHPKLIKSNNNSSLKTGVKLFNQHTAGKLNAHNADVDILFLDTFLQSFKDEKNEFSNYIERLGIKNTYIYRNFLALSKNPKKIANEITTIDILHRKNSARIKQILSHEIPSNLINKFDDSIFESVVNRGIDFFDANGKGRFRVFSLYATKRDNLNNEKQILIIFLIDPYHLVCPVADHQRNLTKKENQHKFFKNCKTYKDSLDMVFSSMFNHTKAHFISLDKYLN